MVVLIVSCSPYWTPPSWLSCALSATSLFSTVQGYAARPSTSGRAVAREGDRHSLRAADSRLGSILLRPDRWGRDDQTAGPAALWAGPGRLCISHPGAAGPVDISAGVSVLTALFIRRYPPHSARGRNTGCRQPDQFFTRCRLAAPVHRLAAVQPQDIREQAPIVPNWPAVIDHRGVVSVEILVNDEMEESGVLDAGADFTEVARIVARRGVELAVGRKLRDGGQ